ncbi:MAG: hypothetical protein AAF602_05565, partial [Myxococcota bacterium]
STRALVAASFGLALLFTMGLGAAWFFAQPGEAPTSPRDATVDNLIDSARVALAEGRLVDAEALWEESTRIATESEALRAEREALTSEIRLRRRIRALEQLGEVDPSDAHRQARHLAREHPQREDVADLVAELAHKVNAAR